METAMQTIELLTLQNVADLFQVRPRKVRDLVHDNGLPHLRVGRQFRFRRKDVDRWLAERTEAVPRPGAAKSTSEAQPYDWSKRRV
jgi:excisionase family DNA binding protein